MDKISKLYIFIKFIKFKRDRRSTYPPFKVHPWLYLTSSNLFPYSSHYFALNFKPWHRISKLVRRRRVEFFCSSLVWVQQSRNREVNWSSEGKDKRMDLKKWKRKNKLEWKIKKEKYHPKKSTWEGPRPHGPPNWFHHYGAGGWQDPNKSVNPSPANPFPSPLRTRKKLSFLFLWISRTPLNCLPGCWIYLSPLSPDNAAQVILELNWIEFPS